MQRIDGSLGIAQGSVMMFSDYRDGGPMWAGSGNRESRQKVRFDTPFRAPPMVMVGVSLWDAAAETNLRADLAAESITPDGFDLVFRTWSDSRHARLRADWIALGPLGHPDDWEL